MEKQLYYVYSDFLKEKYGEKVYKLPINLPITCPNRQNGKNGCSFCADVGTGFEARENSLSVTKQLELNREHIKKRYHAQKFIAYFQNFTNTWMPLEQFKNVMSEAAEFPDIVEISVSTRPDCIKREYLDVLLEIKKKHNIEITLELGLQTVNYHTLQRIDRGHGLAAYIASTQLISSYGFLICTHLILNLPYDKVEDVKEMAAIISALPVQIVKLHSLYVPKNTKLSYEYENGTISICSSEEYIERLILFITHVRTDMVVERLFSRIPEEDSVFSNWGKSWWVLMEEWQTQMKERGLFQGCYYIPANETAFVDIPKTGW